MFEDSIIYSDLSDLQKEVVEAAKANPHRYVLKPQREGGGENVYMGLEVVFSWRFLFYTQCPTVSILIFLVQVLK